VINIDVNKSLGFQLSKIAQEMDWRFSELLKEYQINSRDYGILLAISNKEDLTQINVGDLLKIDRTTIGQLIDCLEMKELIFRKRNPQDRRQNIVLLTDSGRELVETMWLKMLEVEKEVLNDLSGIQEKVILDIAQFIKMYSSVIGNWSGLLIAFIAFMCIFGTTITVVDGYSRANAESLRLILRKKEVTTAHFNIWMIVTVIFAMIIVFFFAGNGFCQLQELYI